MSDFDQPSHRLRTIGAAPEPLRDALREVLPDEGSVRLLIYTPPSESNRMQHGAAVLAVTDNGWMCVERVKAGDCHTLYSDFAHVALVELTEILLYGTLKIHFADGGEQRTLRLKFSTMTGSLYWDALLRLLAGMNGAEPGPPVDRKADLPLLDTLPLKFRNSAWVHVPPDEYVLAVTQWPAAVSGGNRWWQRELAPEGMFALCERDLLLITEERAWSWIRIGRVNKYGDVTTYCPRTRLAEVQLRKSDGNPLATLDIAVRAGGITRVIEIPMPIAYGDKACALVQQALCRKETGGPRAQA